MLTLWDLVLNATKRRPPKRAAKPRPPAARRSAAQAGAAPKPGSMQDRYARMTHEALHEHGVRVRKWRSSMSGIAWQVTYKDGSRSRLIEAPRPKGPVSAAIFLHEIGHHAIGFHTYRPRCLEEHQAWAWAIAEMERRGLNITPQVLARVHDSLHYAVEKARRRGLKRLPADLLPYIHSRVPGQAVVIPRLRGDSSRDAIERTPSEEDAQCDPAAHRRRIP